MTANLLVPQDLLDVEAFKKLPASEKSLYVEKVVEKILDLNQGSGVTIPSILESTEFDRGSVSKYLEKLVAKRVAYKVVQGQTIVYHKNGRLIHHIFKRDIDFGKRSFSFKALFDGKEILVYIQENKKNPLGIIEEGGGIIIPLKEIKQFSEHVSKIESEIPVIKNKFMEMIE